MLDARKCRADGKGAGGQAKGRRSTVTLRGGFYSSEMWMRGMTNGVRLRTSYLSSDFVPVEPFMQAIHTLHSLPCQAIFYYLGLDRKRAAFERGTAQEVRHTLGARISRPVATERPGLDFDYEGLWQFGTFGSGNIRAWTVASETGYRFPTVRLKPRFSAKADISSGDNPNSKTLGTFNPLFPKGNYFGVLATTGPGPINFIDVHPHVETTFPHNVTVSADWIFQWRENVLDGVYAVPGFLIVPAGNSRARFVGHRPGTEIRWQANRHLWLQADYGIFYAGKFLKESSPGRNLNYWALWAGYEF